MTVGLQITDGTTTIDLNDATYFEIIDLDIGYGDISAQTVTGSVRLFLDTTKANIQTELAALQKMLQAAVEFSGTGQGAQLYSSLDKQIYLNYRTDGTENYYRSQLYRVFWSLAPEEIKTLNFDCGGIEYIIEFERWNWWEGPEAQLELSNLTATDTTNALTVYNPYLTYIASTIAFVQATSKITDTANGLANFKTGDTIWVRGTTSNNGRYTIATGGVAGEIVTNEALINEGAGTRFYIYGPVCNYAQITGADVTGDLPAQVRLELANNFDATAKYSSNSRLSYIWVGQNFTNPLIFNPVLASGSSPDAGVSVNLASGVETTILTWTLDDAFMDAAAGRYFKFIAGFKTALLSAYAIRYRVKMIYDGSFTLWKTSYVRLDSSTAIGVRDMFTFQLPPMLAGLSGMQEITLALSAYQETGSTVGLTIDWAQLLPVDGFFYNNIRLGAVLNERVMDDGFNNLYYLDNGSGVNKIPLVVTNGQSIALQPGRTQKLYFIMHSSLGDTHYVGESLGVKVYYRPRRLSV